MRHTLVYDQILQNLVMFPISRGHDGELFNQVDVKNSERHPSKREHQTL